MKLLSFLALAFALVIQAPGLLAQTSKNLYMPREIKSAYDQKTRDFSGKPGERYFQNAASYDIRVTFEPRTFWLTGNETIIYKNNSRDTLNRLYFNLYQDLYKKGAPRDAGIDPANIHDGVEVLEVSIGGKIIRPEQYRSFSTVFHIPVEGGLVPGGVAEIEFRWREKMPVTVARRQGTYKGSNFFIAYWYPKMCVYDDIEGWNTAGYTGQAEFYGDFSDYRVEITVPAEYTVWSSGVLQNPAEIFYPDILNRLAEAGRSDSVVRIITKEDRSANRVTLPAEKHTWRYGLTGQTDFAFGLSKTYLWDAISTPVESSRVQIHSVYSPEAVNCSKIPGFGRQAVQYYSAVSPALPFPEECVTFFEGGPGGMEFPGMVNQQDFRDGMESMMVTVHELGHIYLPFYAGSNEQKYGWMDEGLFTLIGFMAFCDQAGDKEMNFLQMLSSKYAEDAGLQAVDVPMMQMSYKLGDFTYGFVTYVKSAAAFLVLSDYLGQEKFTKGVREFLMRWKGMHPTPYDFFATFNEVAGEDLAWFWEPWFFSYGYADLALGKVTGANGKQQAEIINLGGYPVPVKLKVKYADGRETLIERRMDWWKNGEKSRLLEIPTGTIAEIKLDPARIPDANSANNNFKAR